MRIPIEVIKVRTTVRILALLDSGATHSFISPRLVEQHRWKTEKLRKPMQVFNADASQNSDGTIQYKVPLYFRIGRKVMFQNFYITNIGDDDLVLGMTWLQRYDPMVSWVDKKIRFPDGTNERSPDAPKPITAEWAANKKRAEVESEEPVITNLDDAIKEDNELIWIRAKFTPAQQAAEKAQQQKPVKTLEQLVPTDLMGFKFVFEKKASERLPERKPWDHAIDLKEGAVPRPCKVYPLNPVEQQALDEFLKEQLAKGYIRPSKSPMASPFFFVKKKDGALRPVQDYRYLNSITIKNQYPLPLIPELLDKLKGAKIFSKMDIRWGYNNVRIKEGDEWKAAFKTNRGLYEPTVMFFGLTNSPATFQSLMNHIFADLIDTGKVIIYMDDILIFTATMEEHDKLIHLVLQRLKDNDLFLKPEKCLF